MKLGITFKLFFAVLLTGIVVTLAMGAATRWTFERYFLEYVKQREARRIDHLTSTLVDVYRRDGNWLRLRNNSSAWIELSSAPPPRDDMTLPGNDASDDGYSALDPGGLRADNGSAILRSRGNGSHPADRSSPLSPIFQSDRTTAVLPFDGAFGLQSAARVRRPSPFTLLDADGSWVAGRPAPSRDAPRHDIALEGRVVGRLVTPMPDRMADEADRRFQAQQTEATWIIGSLSVLLAALVSVCLARIFLAPLRRLGRATRHLAAGDYATRVEISSSDELGRLGEDFNRLAYSLERNEALRRELVADISHELRTPLAVMRGELEALQDGIRPLTPDAIVSLQSEVHMLTKMVGDLYDLALADIGALSYRMEPVDMTEIAVTVCDVFRERLASRHIELQLDLPAQAPLIEGDEQRLAQLLNNLLENSVRYTDPGGTARIEIGTEGEKLIVQLADSAPGVPEESLPRLFDRLYRVEASRSRDSGGAGLGLAICQSIVAAHGGTIEATASRFGGLCMRIALPLLSAYASA
jgi:two-component system sensor histidine kinase BaeS